MRYKKVTILLVLCLLFILNAASSDLPFKVIENPKPNLKEKNFIRLEKIDEIADEVSKDVFLFSPFSVTMDRQNLLFIYDRLQAKILVLDPSFKFVKAFGGVGQGPGEFSGTGRGHSFEIDVGLDQKLYAHDFMARKTLVFYTNGKYIKDIRNPTTYGPTFLKPLVDKKGNLVLQEFRDDKVVIFNHRGETFFSIPHKEKKKEILFKEVKVLPGPYKELEKQWLKGPFYYDGSELEMRLTSKSTLIVYFGLSATIYVVDLKEIKSAKKFRVWPEEALKLRKKHLEKREYGYSPLFGRIFIDRDQDDIFYLTFGKNENKSIHCIYKINLDGDLIGVLYIPIDELSGSPRFLLKQNKMYFAREDEKISIYKEIKK